MSSNPGFYGLCDGAMNFSSCWSFQLRSRLGSVDSAHLMVLAKAEGRYKYSWDWTFHRLFHLVCFYKTATWLLLCSSKPKRFWANKVSCHLKLLFILLFWVRSNDGSQALSRNRGGLWQYFYSVAVIYETSSWTNDCCWGLANFSTCIETTAWAILSDTGNIVWCCRFTILLLPLCRLSYWLTD